MTRSRTASRSLSYKKCIASSICSVRMVALPFVNAASTRPSTTSTIAISSQYSSKSIIRSYSTPSSSIQGTVSSGAAGIQDEAVRTVEALVAPEHLDEKERQIWDTLMAELQCTELQVQDISGGCGSMYGIEIVSEKFRGLNMLKQQRLVNQVLGEEIKKWHGVQLKTRAP
jgi:stress-induced morphogen